MNGKQSALSFFILAVGLLNLFAEMRAGLGIEFSFTGSVPFGGGAGISARFEKVPLAVTLSGTYLHGNHGTIKGTIDYWFLSEKITNINDTISFHWFAGCGGFADTIMYSIPVSVNSGEQTTYKTAIGGGFGIRMPIGCYVYAEDKKYEPYLQCSPECGIRFYPKNFTRRISLLWSFPISLGCRFWF